MRLCRSALVTQMVAGRKCGIVHARRDHDLYLKSFSRGRLTTKRCLLVESVSAIVSGSQISGSILQRSGWEYSLMSEVDINKVHLHDDLRRCTVILVDSLVFLRAADSSPASFVNTLRSSGYDLAIVCLLQTPEEVLVGRDYFDGVIVKPLHLGMDHLLELASTAFLNSLLWLDGSDGI